MFEHAFDSDPALDPARRCRLPCSCRVHRQDAAVALVDRVAASIDLLSDGRFDGPRDTLLTGEVVRPWLVEPYILFYRRRDGVVEVVRLLHGRRRPVSRGQ